jgi:hypothetical protein
MYLATFDHCKSLSLNLIQNLFGYIYGNLFTKASDYPDLDPLLKTWKKGGTTVAQR